MTTVNFPLNPIIGEIFSSGDRSWEWDGYSWNVISTTFTTNNLVVTNNAILGNTSVNGWLNVSSFTVTANLQVTDTATVNNLVVTGSTSNTVNANSAVFGNLQVTGTSTLNTVSSSTTNTLILQTGNLYATGTSNVNILNVSGAMDISNNLTVRGYANVYGDLQVNSTALFNNNVTVVGQANLVGNVYIHGELTAANVTYLSSNTLLIGDNKIVLNSDVSGAPSEDAGIIVNRGTSANVEFFWNETDDRWQVDQPLYSNGMITVANSLATRYTTYHSNTSGNYITAVGDLSLRVGYRLLANVAGGAWSAGYGYYITTPFRPESLYNSVGFDMSFAFAPDARGGSQTANFTALKVSANINQTNTANGSYAVLQLISTPTSYLGNLETAYALVTTRNGTDYFKVTDTGSVTAVNTITSNTSVVALSTTTNSTLTSNSLTVGANGSYNIFKANSTHVLIGTNSANDNDSAYRVVINPLPYNANVANGGILFVTNQSYDGQQAFFAVAPYNVRESNGTTAKISSLINTTTDVDVISNFNTQRGVQLIKYVPLANNLSTLLSHKYYTITNLNNTTSTVVNDQSFFYVQGTIAGANGNLYNAYAYRSTGQMAVGNEYVHNLVDFLAAPWTFAGAGSVINTRVGLKIDYSNTNTSNAWGVYQTSTTVPNYFGGPVTFGSYINVATTAAFGNTTISGFANVTSTLNVVGNANIVGTFTVSNTVSSGNTTITGFANVTSTFRSGGDANVVGTFTVSNTVSLGNTTINGFANVTSTLNIVGNANVIGTFTVSNTVSLGNTTITGFANVTSTFRSGGDANIVGTFTVSNTVTLGNTTISGFANVTSTLNVVGNANIVGTFTVSNTVSSGNTTINGFANVTSTFRSGGDANIVGTFTVSNTVSLGNTTITGFANVSTTLNVTGNITTSSNTLVVNLNADLFDNTHLITVSESLRANRALQGGNVITVDPTGYIHWSSRFIVLGNGRGAHFSTNGYFDITCPTSGTITGVGGASDKTATANGVPIGAWESLYYIMPIGNVSTTINANFRVASYTSDLEVPHDWVLICSRNGDTGRFHFNNGITLSVNQSLNTTSYSTFYAYNTYLFNGQTASYYANASNLTTGTVGRPVSVAGDGSIIVSGTSAFYSPWSCGLQLREVGLVTNTQSAANYAPGINFHWGATVASSLKLHSDGSFHFRPDSADVTAHSDVVVRDLWAYRTDGQGFLYLGNSGSRYIHYNNTDIYLYGAPVQAPSGFRTTSCNATALSAFSGGLHVSGSALTLQTDTLYVGAYANGSSSVTASYIRMGDSDHNVRILHTNSGRIGFLDSSNGWSMWSANNGTIYCAKSLSFGSQSDAYEGGITAKSFTVSSNSYKEFTNQWQGLFYIREYTNGHWALAAFDTFVGLEIAKQSSVSNWFLNSIPANSSGYFGLVTNAGKLRVYNKTVASVTFRMVCMSADTIPD